MLSRKQELYKDILELLLPHARNVQTWGVISRALKSDLYPELEWVHNIPPLMSSDDVDRQDIYWLNTQAKNYLLACEKGERPHSGFVKSNIEELVKLVPSNLEGELNDSLKGKLGA